MRAIDDKIVYALNTSVPTESFKRDSSANQTCKELSEKLEIVYNDRNKFIRNCIASTANRVQRLKQTKDNNPDDASANKNFKSESRKVRDLFSMHHNDGSRLYFLFLFDSKFSFNFGSCGSRNPN